MGRGEASLYSGAKYNNITTTNRVIWLKLMHNYVTEFLRLDQYETNINETKDKVKCDKL